MIQNNTAGMAALDAPIKAAQAAIDDLTTEMYTGMGAYEHGKKGNQLLHDDKWSGYTPEENKATPNKGNMSPTGNADKPGLHLTNSKPQFETGDTPAYVTGLDDDEKPIAITNADVSDPTSDFWLTHERPEPFDPNDPNLADAPLKSGVKEPDYTKYIADSGEKDAAGASSGGLYKEQGEEDGMVGVLDGKSRINEKGNVEVSNEEIEAKLKEMFPGNYVEGSLKMTDQEPMTKDTSEFMAGLTNVGRGAILDIPFWGASEALAAGSKLLNVGKHATEAAKMASNALSKGTNFALGELGGSILGEILNVPDELPGKKTRYLITANLNGNENSLLNVDVNENGQIVITYFNPQVMGW